MSEQREAITEVLDDVLARAHFGENVVPMAVTERQADAILAYLYQRADDPEVVEEIRESLYTGGPIAADLAAKDRQTRYTETTIEKVLTALIGPRPQGESDE